MPTPPLHLRLTPGERSGVYMLAYDDASYSIEFRPDMDVTLGDLLRRVKDVLVGGRDPSGQMEPPELLRAVGTRLWQALLPDTAPVEAREGLARALRGGGSAVWLALPDELRDLPWELLYDPQAKDDRGFVARRRPLARVVPGEEALPPLEPPLKVLLLISSPLDLEPERRVDVESERAAVESAVQSAREEGLLHLMVEDIVTPRRVQQALIRFRPHVVHYVGHGGYAEDIGGVLTWEDDSGNTRLMPGRVLADLFGPRGLRAVILHSCQTARGNQPTDFRGVAAVLVDAGIPAVLAQQANFSYESSQRASEMFYTALTAGLGMDEATHEARRAMVQAGRPDWAVPQLQATVGGLQALLDGGAAPGVADPALNPPRVAADLPAPTGVFVGRQPDLRALRAMLESAPGSGPVMALITGPGGVGKSTLASRAVTRYGGRYKAGLTLRCQGYQSFDLFLQQIGEFLAQHGAPGFLSAVLPDPNLSTEAKTQIAVQTLNGAGQFLLIVDNLESVQGDDLSLTDPELLRFLQLLLTNLQNGRVLVTGRYAVKGLLPDGKFGANLLHLSLDDLTRYEVGQLMDRHPALARLGNATRNLLINEFGGLPYIYDLLSSRAASMNLEGLVRDIQGRVTEERERRSTEEWDEVRQQVVEFAALDATVEWLSEPSRALLGQLSVFRRPFPLEAMEQGLGTPREVWQPLLDWSLLRFDPGEGEYRLHSLTTRYADGLIEETERKATQVHVAEWYLLRGFASHYLGDVLEAHRLFSEAGEAERAGTIATQFGEILHRLGLYEIARTLSLTAVRDVEGVTAAEAKRQLGILAHLQGDYKEAKQWYNEALTDFERLGHAIGYSSTLHELGLIAQDQGEYVEARRLVGESLSIKERLDDQLGLATALTQLATTAHAQGNHEEAQSLYRRALVIVEREDLNNHSIHAHILHGLGLLEKDQGEYVEAQRLYEESLAIFQRIGDQDGSAHALHDLGLIAQEQGRYTEAQRLYVESLIIRERLGNHSKRAKTLRQLGVLAQYLDDPVGAKRLYEEVFTVFAQGEDEDEYLRTVGLLAGAAEQQGDYEAALTYALNVLTICQHSQSPLKAVAWRALVRYKDKLGMEAFSQLWQRVTEGQPLPFILDDSNQELLDSLRAIVEAPTWDEAQRQVQEQPDLLTDKASVLLAQVAAMQEHDAVRLLIELYSRLLARCREIGVEDAFAELESAVGEKVPEGLHSENDNEGATKELEEQRE